MEWTWLHRGLHPRKAEFRVHLRGSLQERQKSDREQVLFEEMRR